MPMQVLHRAAVAHCLPVPIACLQAARTTDSSSRARADGGQGQEHTRKVFYERAIQTLEQQLQEFQRHLSGEGERRPASCTPPYPHPSGRPWDAFALDDISDRSDEGLLDGPLACSDEGDESTSGSELELEEARDDAEVAAYVCRSECAPVFAL
jgi:hypothetical protein